MKIQQFQFNPFQENTYVVYDDSKDCVIIDPGCFTEGERNTLAEFVEDHDLKVKYLLNTHMHLDHIFGNHFVEHSYNLKTIAHKEDEYLAHELSSSLKRFGFNGDEVKEPTLGGYLNEGDTLRFGNQKFDIYHVPGHSKGSIVFYNLKAGVIISGDVLFSGSIGRTDLEGGDYDLLITGIKKKLLVLPSSTIVYSGHGPNTTIGREIQINPFIQ